MMVAMFMFLGTSLYVFFQAFPQPEAAEMLDGTRNAEQVLPFFIMNYVPRGITGLLIAAALAAAMSSLDSSINAIATCGVTDIYRRFLVRDRDDRHYLRVAWGIAAAAALMIGGAIYLARADTMTIQHTLTIVVSLLSGGMLGIYLLGFLTRQGGAAAVWVGIVCTTLFTLWNLLSGANMLHAALTAPFELYCTQIIGNLIMFTVGYLAALLLPTSRRAVAGLTILEPEPEH